ncbi:MAG: hypothetical protein WA005_11490 [Candidatus Binataceae bacterium]
MKLTPYSSLAAFAAHYRALRSSKEFTEDERARLAEMNEALDTLGADIRAVLDSEAAGDGAAMRRRERAERKLRRELIARGMLTG